MFVHHGERLSEVTPRVLFHWFLLSFAAGNINAGGFLACGRFVSHVTGTATMIGVDLGSGRIASGIGMIGLWIFFILGVMISACLVDRRLTAGERPRYSLVMGFASFLLFSVALSGHLRAFGQFGEIIHLHKEIFFLALLSVASGLMNAAITTSSGAFVRITHVSGITTDLGIGIMRMVGMDPRDPAYRTERVANAYRGGAVLSFSAGAFVGTVLYLRVEYLGFLLPGALALYAMVLAAGSAPASADARFT